MITTRPISVVVSASRRMRSAVARVTSAPSSGPGFQQLDRIAVVSGAREQALLAAGPGGEPQLRHLPGALEPQPGERRRGARAAAGGGDRRQQALPFGL